MGVLSLGEGHVSSGIPEGSAGGASKRVPQSVAFRVWGVGSGLVWVNGGFCTSWVLLFPLWCVFLSLCLGGFVCGSCVFCDFRVSLVWLRSALMRSRSTLCEVPLEDIWRRPVPSSRAGRGEVCLVWVARG